MRPPFDPMLIQDPAGKPRLAALTVTQLTALVKRTLREAIPGRVNVTGEISNFKRHTGGHVYFTLKDAQSELSCVMWRSAAAKLKFQPQDGMEVIATGEVDVFEKAGRYQLYVRRLEPRGTGPLELAFRQLCEKLQKEGLFDSRHKKPIPSYPRHVVLITSPTGAAVKDMLQTIQRRYPCITVSIYPVAVQGDKAAPEIATAIKRLSDGQERLGGIDVMIVGRGGGSLEDLWAFNEEIVARAIFASTIPIISAVGHEVDTTISDLVADLRAPTPTAAAELVVPVKQELLEQLNLQALRLRRTIAHRFDLFSETLTNLARREPLRAPQRMIENRVQHLDHLHTKLSHAARTLCHDRSRRLGVVESSLRLIEPNRYVAGVQKRALELSNRLALGASNRLRRAERSLNDAGRRLAGRTPLTLLELLQQRLLVAQRLLATGLQTSFERNRLQLTALQRQLQGVGYRRTLQRGYTVTRHGRTGKLVTEAKQVAPGVVVQTETAAGRFASTVNPEAPEQMDLFE